MVRYVFWAALLIASSSKGYAGPYGNPVMIHTTTSGDQRVGSAAVGANGDSLIQWCNLDGGTNFYGRRSTAGGIVLGDDWYGTAPVNGIAMSGSGSFAIMREMSDGSGKGVYVTVYNRSGSAIVPNFRVNDTTAGDQVALAIAMNANGQFAVAWAHNPTHGVYFKRFQANGAAMGPEQVVLASAVALVRIDVAINDQGATVVSWDQGLDTSNYDVYARRYDAYGIASPAFLVNTTTAGKQYGGQVAMSGNGDFVIAWNGNQSGSWNLYGQRFNSMGTRIGGEFTITTTATYYMTGVELAMAGDGRFTVVWADYNTPNGWGQILARSYDGNGSALGAPFIVSPDSTTARDVPVIAMDPDGNAIMAWNQYNFANSTTDVYSIRYQPDGVVAAAIPNGSPVSGLSGAAGSWQYFKVTVPAGHSVVDFTISGVAGDADLYVRYGAVPTATRWDGRPFLTGSNEGVRMLSFPPGDWYIGVNGYTAYSSLTLRAVSQ